MSYCLFILLLILQSSMLTMTLMQGYGCTSVICLLSGGHAECTFFFYFFPACSQFWLTAQSAVGVLQLMVLPLVSSVQDGKFLTMVVALLWKCEFFAAFLMKILRELWNTHSSTGGQWFYRYRQISMWNKKCSMQTLGLGCVSCKQYSVTHDAAHLNICCLS